MIEKWRSNKAKKKLRTSKGDNSIKYWSSSIASLFKTGTYLKGKNLLLGGANSFAPRGSEFFPLRAVRYGMKNYFYHIRWPPLNVTTLFYFTRALLRYGSYANEKSIICVHTNFQGLVQMKFVFEETRNYACLCRTEAP